LFFLFAERRCCLQGIFSAVVEVDIKTFVATLIALWCPENTDVGDFPAVVGAVKGF